MRDALLNKMMNIKIILEKVTHSVLDITLNRKINRNPKMINCKRNKKYLIQIRAEIQSLLRKVCSWESGFSLRDAMVKKLKKL